ncbi:MULTISPECIES: helix-turn-helix domain-containing protein [Rhizobium/Agrobacterium group]|uniref:Transcriptional regulator n=2 Tax=Rhizobium/Agrobacterium group TaxID=227290 RepID=A0AA88JTB2_RHIRH|nr:MULTISPECIES: helix-turn-helix domain-containing protein [Rhizobium/Agrobacterium group]KAA3503075.1 transcriptional regulator [Rhizobium rhizogenes]MBO0133857.1 helix-turn-helix domain-containing protein [Agrobacterium burrii]NTZ89945.1 transcriptional regulator [Agrobacterium tumefaciens]
MTALTVRLGTIDDIKSRFVAAGNLAMSGKPAEAKPSVEFSSYEDLHRILAPLRLAIVRALSGQGTLSIREVARRVGRDVQAVHRDVTTLLHAGIIDRNNDGIAFPYDSIHFEFDVKAGEAA